MNTHPRRPVTGAATIALAFLMAACGEADPIVPEPTDPCAPEVIAFGSSVTGSIDAGGCRRGGHSVDRWTFDLSAETDVRIDLTSSAIDPVLELQTMSGRLIAYNDDFGSLNSMIITRLAAGSYIIQARDYRGGTGSYQLSLREGPDCGPLGELQLGETEAGSLSSDDCIWEEGGFSDNWALTVAEQANLRIQAKSPDFDEVVIIRDARGAIVNGAGEYGPEGFARFDMTVPAGEWTITVGALTPGRTGGYELTVDLTPPCAPGSELVLGQTESGAIDFDDCRLDGYVPADSFALVLDREASLDFNLKSSDMRPALIVRDADRHDVVFADDWDGTGSARTRATLEPGRYAVYATTFDHPPTGSYQLTVAELVCEAASSIAFGSTESGVLDADDCLRANGALQEPWSLELAAETVVRIDLESDDFDSYLILEDDLGNVLGENDDGGEGYDARIETTLSAGSYVIVATAFTEGQQGTYTLTVGAPPAQAPATASFVTATGSEPDSEHKESDVPELDWRDRAVELGARLVPAWLGGGKGPSW